MFACPGDVKSSHANVLISRLSFCSFFQAGKQIEYLTGGHVLAGFHEVVVNAATVEQIKLRRASGKSLWRVSSTCFGHIRSDEILEPLSPFKEDENFPPKYTGDQVALKYFTRISSCINVSVQVQEELAAIDLRA